MLKDFVEFSDENDIGSHPMKLLSRGVDRFRHTSNSSLPRSFCWDTGSYEYEDKSKSKIEFNFTHAYEFQHPEYENFSTYKSNISALVMVSSSINPREIDKLKYMTISKMYYAKRHGYKFFMSTSAEYESYFASDLFNEIANPNSKIPYFRGIMTKPLMILDCMYQHLDIDWILFTDSDVYPNTGWLYLPLDVFLQDVPESKVLVTANYRSAFTNILLIRNNPKGRKLILDWLAITMSGYVQVSFSLFT